MWLKTKTPELQALGKNYSWIATNGSHILKDSREARLLAENGLTLPRNTLSV
jgi:hypothetical protein